MSDAFLIPDSRHSLWFQLDFVEQDSLNLLLEDKHVIWTPEVW